jgi:predicted Na+-dependent transporter
MGMKWDVLFKLLQSLMFPILLFGIAVPKRRPRWADRRFQLTVVAALLIHALLFATVASRVEHLKPIITAALAFAEFLIWVIADGWLMGHAARTSK